MLTSKRRDSKNHKSIFPFKAIIGQVQLKIALILNVLDHRIGWVIVMRAWGIQK